MKAAVVGTGAMGRLHLSVLASMETITRIAACDLSEDALAKVQEEYPAVETYTDFAQMLTQEQPDILHVVTTGPYHAKLVIQACETGVKRILCEKPIATNIADAQAMQQAAKQHNVLLTINHSRRWYQTYVELKQKLANGHIGDIKTVHMVVGGGRLGCMGTHLFDLCRMLTGKNVKTVHGFVDDRYTGDHKGRNVFDPGGYVLLQMDDNVKAFIDMSEDLGIPLQTMITGSMGYLTINEKRQECFIYARNGEDKEKRLGQYGLPLHKTELPLPEVLDLRELLKKAVEELLTNQEPRCTAEDGRAAVEMTLAAHLSSQQENKPITLPLQDTTFDVKIT